MKIGIIQPGSIGDIIILLPAMKVLYNQGNEIYWPIFKEHLWLFRDMVNYINFIPVEHDVYNVVNICNKLFETTYNVDKVYDIAATFPGSISTEEYVQCGDGNIENFDAFKYRKLNISIDEKWNLRSVIIRNQEKEDELYKKLVHNEKYAVACLTCSQGKYNVNFDRGSGQLIEVTPEYNIFHWIKILEHAQTIVVLNSAFFCLTEQLNLPNRKIVYRIPTPKFPVLRNKWEIL